ncbi:hypothetical protein OD91_1604 [Lutibacter sp. Hel_I_33_5]|uniref:hypothetical protein n=1 Tax=Lutibacter sp. Hel_I_33_5 TaxID=1566289 RepID=UPI0011A2D40C|nr:hypothetical protein [Lutibacter sp. Hel_I_33_5]TVZ56320.1 hypothetical protein OD91_1604 [Lutibacter sp. Hel_I_33_5]
MKKIILILSLFVFASCENNSPTINPDNLLLGNWSHSEYNNGEITFKRVDQLPNEENGISIKAEGVFLERTSGWCGTPPLSFFDIDGTWTLLEKDKIEIHTDTYQGTLQWNIISVTEKELIVTRTLTEQEKEHQNLMNLFAEIQDIANSLSCKDALEWLFTAYGSKACGGPQGYIAYSKKIDTVNFLNKVAIYTEGEKEYNIKWDINSTCDITPQPTGVKCENDYPTLLF